LGRPWNTTGQRGWNGIRKGLVFLLVSKPGRCWGAAVRYKGEGRMMVAFIIGLMIYTQFWIGLSFSPTGPHSLALALACNNCALPWAQEPGSVEDPSCSIDADICMCVCGRRVSCTHQPHPLTQVVRRHTHTNIHMRVCVPRNTCTVHTQSQSLVECNCDPSHPHTHMRFAQLGVCCHAAPRRRDKRLFLLFLFVAPLYRNDFIRPRNRSLPLSSSAPAGI
jgi:hypothetical protein